MGRGRVVVYAAAAIALLLVTYWLTDQLFSAMCESDCTEEDASGSWVWAGLATFTLMLAVVAVVAVVAVGEATVNWRSRPPRQRASSGS